MTLSTASEEPQAPAFEGGATSGAADALAGLCAQIEDLVTFVEREGAAQAQLWRARIDRAAFAPAADNLACYLAARRRDLRRLQQHLMVRGLSSLGRMESRVLPTLRAVKAALYALDRRNLPARPSAREMMAGERRLYAARREVFGRQPVLPVALLVTCPTEAAEDPNFMLSLAQRKVSAVRINCAHDDAARWRRMIGFVREAEQATGHRLKIFMDLAGPKIRTGAARLPAGKKRLVPGDRFTLAGLGRLDLVPQLEGAIAVECTLSEALRASGAGDRVFIDDGKLEARVEAVDAWGVQVCVSHAPARGLKLRPELGLNFPDAVLGIGALTDKDLEDLSFIAAHADGVEFSFVQSAADVAALQDALAARSSTWRDLTLILKIETAKAIANLPELVVQAAGRQPAAIMIARGDLAVEIGFTRTAEMQEEILWLGEAAAVPVIWATQVLDHMIRKGVPSRGEMTDAAMAARAECVMLNKGPYLMDAIEQLENLWGRMAAHQHKKTARLRRLKSWTGP
jgi:pyruvate kinase